MTAWGALLDAMSQNDPACRDDPRFTDDTTPASALVSICEGCPLFAECRSVVDSASRGQIWGIWAGRERRIKRQVRPRTVSRAG